MCVAINTLYDLCVKWQLVIMFFPCKSLTQFECVVELTKYNILMRTLEEIQVRHAQILERGQVETSLLGKHQGRAHKLAIEPGSPYIFYTCGEDGLVQHVSCRSLLVLIVNSAVTLITACMYLWTNLKCD